MKAAKQELFKENSSSSFTFVLLSEIFSLFSLPNTLQFGSLISVEKVPNLTVKNEPILGRYMYILGFLNLPLHQKSC